MFLTMSWEDGTAASGSGQRLTKAYREFSVGLRPRYDSDGR